jgi:glycosyltransferase involved in cell wall biosynthesis
MADLDRALTDAMPADLTARPEESGDPDERILSRVLFVITTLGTGGAERSLLELVDSVRDYGIEPMVVVLEHRDVGVADAVVDLGISVHLLQRGPFAQRARALRAIVRGFEPDIVHTSIYDANLLARVALIGIRRTCLLTSYVNATYEQVRIDNDPNVHRLRLRVVQALDAITLHLRTNHVHAISQVVADAVHKRLAWSTRRTTVVHRGRDPQRLGEATTERRAVQRSKRGISDSVPVLLCVGRREFQKGHRYLIEAMPKILAAHPSAQLWIAGRDGSASTLLEATVDRLGIAESVRFLGPVQDVADLLAMADVFVFPSLWEGFGGALLEAMALECPIVSSDIAVIREVAGEPPVASLAPPGDHRALAEAVNAMLDSPERRASLAAAARKRFEEQFTAAISVERMVAMYRKVFADAHR